MEIVEVINVTISVFWPRHLRDDDLVVSLQRRVPVGFSQYLLSSLFI